LIRELILQLKTGFLDAPYFDQKFGVNILAEWATEWSSLEDQGFLTIEDARGRIELTRDGLLQVDALLPSFFEPQYQGVRYT
jgi:oxygen-independent coproporphyrinogen-3 oxidase